MKLRSKIIMITVISLILVGGAVALLVSPIGNKIKRVIGFDNTKEEIYTAYVDINPLIKLNFKVSCDKDNNCSNPVITDYELINEDAKTIYKDLVLKDKTLKETIELLGNTVKDNDILFKEVHIYTNYDKKEDFEIESIDYELVLDIKETEELNNFIDELVAEKEKTITKDIILSYQFPKGILERRLEIEPTEDCTPFEFIEHPELYVSRGAVKVTVSGPAELINSLPDSVYEDAFNFSIKAFIEANDYSIGEHITTLNITSEIPEIKVSPTTIKVKYEVREKYDVHVCLSTSLKE